MAKSIRKTVSGARHILSAAVKLGGKMSTTTVRLPITNVYMDGDYTGTIYVGSQKKPCNVTLDTGSSTLAVDGNFYDVTKDKSAKITDIAQEVGYVDGSSWVGAVVMTDVSAGTPPWSFLRYHCPLPTMRPRACFVAQTESWDWPTPS